MVIASLTAMLSSGCSTIPVSKHLAANPMTPLQVAEMNLDCHDDGFVRRETPIIPQENSYWCWAASGQMVENFLKPQVRQCGIATDYCKLLALTCTGEACCKPSADCCLNPADCHVPGWPPFERRQIEFKKVERALTAEEVVRELACEKRPFVFSWAHKKEGGHIMVAVGYATVNGKDFVILNEPWAICKNGICKGDRFPIPFSEYETGSFMHWKDFIELEKP